MPEDARPTKHNETTKPPPPWLPEAKTESNVRAPFFAHSDCSTIDRPGSAFTVESTRWFEQTDNTGIITHVR
jgi:hypothetical protein